MCGIAGYVNFDGKPVNPTLLSAMAATLRHRGPDGSGIYHEAGVGLAHTRLAILDVEGGAQPMRSPDGGVWIVFNGEIYNFIELRADLERRGHRFKTRSDTEVILHLYEEHGEDCVSHLRGMFAFALWDPDRHRLLLARDRVGIKPLFYRSNGTTLVFGSEMKALLLHPEMSREIDPVAISEFMAFQYIPSPRTAFRDIRKLPPAHVLAVSPEKTVLRRYWQLPEEVEPRPETVWKEELDATLRESVRLHMRSDVPVGALLSGGIDSSLVTILAVDSAGTPLKSFSVGFREAAFSELPYARAVADRYRTHHTEFVLEPHGVDKLPDLLAHFDEPFGDSSCIPCSQIAKIAAKHVKVCLSGDGGDEAFGGYDAYALALRLRFVDLIPLGIRRLALNAIERCVPEWMNGKGLLRFLTLGAADRYAEIMGSIDLGTREWLLTADFRAVTKPHHPYERLRALYEDFRKCNPLLRLQRLDLETYLPDDILVKVDRTSMLHSLELRVPLLDHKVLELAFRMPSSLKYHKGTRKRILREIYSALLPAGILSKPKQGFAIPLNAWLRGDLSSLVQDVFTDPITRGRGIVDPAGLDRLLASYRLGRRDLGNEIWSILVLELWFRACVDAPRALPVGGIN